MGLGTRLPLLQKFLAGDFRQAFVASEKYPGLRLITIQEGEDVFAARGPALFIDARPPRPFLEAHVPGALNLPYEADKTRLPDTILENSRNRSLVVYCEGGDCASSLGLAKLLSKAGFKDIRVMTGGWADWKKAGLPEATGRD